MEDLQPMGVATQAHTLGFRSLSERPLRRNSVLLPPHRPIDLEAIGTRPTHTDQMPESQVDRQDAHLRFTIAQHRNCPMVSFPDGCPCRTVIVTPDESYAPPSPPVGRDTSRNPNIFFATECYFIRSYWSLLGALP